MESFLNTDAIFMLFFVGTFIGTIMFVIAIQRIVERREKRAKRHRRKLINEHKANLLKGGLIPRVPKEINDSALSELGREHPNKKLPKIDYYD